MTGFDIDENRIAELIDGFDRTNELNQSELVILDKIKFTTGIEDISNSNIYIITVPTPVDKNNKPDLKPIISASQNIGALLEKGNIVIYESTVFPGCTEEICVPILEKGSKLIYNKDFVDIAQKELIRDKKHTFKEYN